MSCEHGAYYLRPSGKPRVALGRDFGKAMSEYGRLLSATWSGRTLADVIDRYRAEVLPLKRSKKTRTDEERGLLLLRAVFGRMIPADLTPRDCYRYLDMRRTKDGAVAPIAARHEIVLLGHVYSKAIRWGVATHNPCRKLELPKVAVRARYVEDAELQAARGLASDRLQVAIDIAYLTGLRAGDVRNLTRGCLTDEGIAVTASKTSKAAVYTWSPELRAVIDRAKRIAPQLPGTFVVRNRKGRAYTASGFAALWQALMRRYAKAGGVKFQFKDIRAKNASDSASLAEASERLQHSTTAITAQRYMRKAARLKPLK